MVLPEIKVADDHDHAQFVGAIQNQCEAVHVRGPEIPFGVDSRILPRLTPGIPLWTAALEIDRKGEDTMAPPFSQGCDQFTGVAVRVPFAGVGIGPPPASFRVEIVEDALHCANVHEQAFDLHALVPTSGIRGLAIEKEAVALD